VAKKRSGLADKKNRHDRFHQSARDKGYRARAVFKLEELDQRFGLLKRSDRVLDLGCAPGSWLQYAAEKVGPGGALVGIDRVPVELDHPGARILVGDVFETTPAALLADLRAFDVVLSDMAPDTTGIRHVDQTRSEALFEPALHVAHETLSDGGHFVGKLFMGGQFPQLLKACRESFERVKTVKPESSRRESIEQYVVALGKRPR
jgi:23S rRNA (uridine2552-2'-O)-methyltransferase